VPAAPPLDSLERLGDEWALDAPTERKRLLIIVNPYATTVSVRLKNLVVYALQGRYDVTAIETTGRGHATELCREAALEGYDVVVAFGGDGTVNEAANGLAGSSVPLTCLPGGATNVFGKMLGIPGEIVDATEHLLRLADDWRPRRVDLPRVGHAGPDGLGRWRHFTFSAGLGLDASVVERVDSHPYRKARFGAWYYTYAAITSFLGGYVIGPPRLEVELPDGTTLPGVTAIVQNGDPYTYFQNKPVRVADGGVLDDGLLAGAVLRRSTPTVMPTVIWRVFSKRARLSRHRAVDGFTGVDELVVRSTDERELPLQVDGDHIADVTEARFGIAPRALAVVS
jgi:diacylglycerol kinase family enzyme